MKLFVGIDVSPQKLDVCFMDSEDHILHEATLLNDITGASEIKEIILKLSEKLEYDVIKIGGVDFCLQFSSRHFLRRGC